MTASVECPVCKNETLTVWFTQTAITEIDGVCECRETGWIDTEKYEAELLRLAHDTRHRLSPAMTPYYLTGGHSIESLFGLEGK